MLGGSRRSRISRWRTRLAAHFVTRRRWMWVTGVVVVLAAGGAASYVSLRGSPAPAAARTSPHPGRTTTSSSAGSGTLHRQARLRVVSITPRNRSAGVGGSAPISITFSEPISGTSPQPTLNPSVPGSWHVAGGSTLVFTPTEPFIPLSQVTLSIPGGAKGPAGTQGARLRHGVVDNFTIADGSTLRLQQMLSILDYSPLAWSPASSPIAATDTQAQLEALYSPPAGAFSWRNSGWPSQLRAIWQPGRYNVFTRGLVMSFQADHGLTVNGTPNAALWVELLRAVATGVLNSGGYNYAIGQKVPPQSLTIWHNGSVVFHSAANTGIPQSPTPSGTFPVYARYRNEIMRGTNPNGTSYADPVQYVAYFYDGDAVHYFPRADYGVPQSLGCIELPLAAAAAAWPYLAYGTLVTVLN